MESVSFSRLHALAGLKCMCHETAACLQGRFAVGDNKWSPIYMISENMEIIWETGMIEECFAIRFSTDEHMIFLVQRAQGSRAEQRLESELVILSAENGCKIASFVPMLQTWNRRALLCMQVPCPDSTNGVLAIMDMFSPSVALHSMESGQQTHEIEFPSPHCRDMCVWVPGELVIAGCGYIVRANVDGEILQVVRMLFDCYSIVSLTAGVLAAGSEGRRVFHWPRDEFLRETWDTNRFTYPSLQGDGLIDSNRVRGYPLDSQLTRRLDMYEQEMNVEVSRANTCFVRATFLSGAHIATALAQSLESGGLGLVPGEDVQLGVYCIEQGSFASDHVILKVALQQFSAILAFLNGLDGVTATAVPGGEADRLGEPLHSEDGFISEDEEASDLSGHESEN